MNYHDSFEEENIYHVFARANGKEKMFIRDDDYDLFLDRLHKYVMPVADVYAFAFIPNHYHLMIKIKSYQQLLIFAKQKKLHFQESEMWINKLITRQFSNMQNSYCKKINYKYKRKKERKIE